MSSDEVISSEEMLAYVDELNEVLADVGAPEDGICIGSLDVKALYPSLVISACAKICKEKFLESPAKFEDTDMKWASIYLALNMKGYQVI